MTCNNGWVSFISYNSEKFLKRTLDDMVEAKKIDFYWFAPHKGEIDQKTGTRDKDHIHLYLHANGKFDSMKFQDKTKEFDPKHKLPRNCILPWKIKDTKEKLDSELLYSYHDKNECERRREKKEFYYTPDILITNNQEQLDYMLKYAVVVGSPVDQLEKTVKKGGNELELIRKGVFSYRDINYVKAIKEKIKEEEEEIKSRFKKVICIKCGQILNQWEIIPSTLTEEKKEPFNNGICYKCGYINDHPDEKK